MSKVVRFHACGGPEVLRLEDVALEHPGEWEVRVRQVACGVNYIDTYHRSGLYRVDLPSGLGVEASGVVEAVGQGVDAFKVGDRVAYASGLVGAYAEVRNIPWEHLCLLPDSISFEQAAAMMVKGMTAQFLIRRTHQVQPGETVLFHAISGGVGVIACQWLKSLGAIVIGTAGSPEKCELARRNGADYCINYRQEDFAEQVKVITKGAGVSVVYDSVGKDTFEGSIRCLRRFGLMVSFGNASGPVPPFPPRLLAESGSLYLTRPTLFHHIAERDDLEAISGELFEMVGSGKVQLEVNHRYALADASSAHQDLEARNTTGPVILMTTGSEDCAI